MHSVYSPTGWLSLIGVFLLMFVNWGIEAVKWMVALRGMVTLGFISSLRSVWAGVVAGLLTPNRVGEPLGRVAEVPEGIRGRAALLAAWCSVNQLAATLAFGIIGFAIIRTYPCLIPSVVVSPWVSLSVLALLLVAILFFVLRIQAISGYLSRVFARLGVTSNEGLMVSVPASIRVWVWVLSATRYGVFAVQLFLLLRLVGVQGGTDTIFGAIFLTYLLATITPSFAISDPGVRASFGVVIIGCATGCDPTLVVLATFTLWVINLALPAALYASGMVGRWSYGLR